MKKLLILFPIFFMFLFTLGGCSPSGIVIRNMADATPAQREGIVACGPNNLSCQLTQYERIRPTTSNEVLFDVAFAEEDFLRARAYLFASFNTGRASTGAISWALTIDGREVLPTLPDWHPDGLLFVVDENMNTAFVEFQYAPPPTGKIVLTASVEGLPSRTIELIMPGATRQPSNQRN